MGVQNMEYCRRGFTKYSAWMAMLLKIKSNCVPNEYDHIAQNL